MIKLISLSLFFSTTVLAQLSNMAGFEDVILKLSKPNPNKESVWNYTLTGYHMSRVNEQYRHMLTDGLLDAVFKQTAPDGSVINRNIFNDSMTDNLLIDMNEILTYGCWCNFGDNWRKGRSKPVNNVDGFCKDLMNCYKCVQKDHDSEGLSGICDATEEDYNGPSLIRVQQVGTLQACSEENNDDPCKTRVCSCDTNFVFNLMQAFFAGEVFDASPQHGGSFDVDLECPKANNVAINKDCCGIYPKRFPFGVSSNRQCCVTKTYNPNSLNCCVSPDGMVGTLQLGIC